MQLACDLVRFRHQPLLRIVQVPIIVIVHLLQLLVAVNQVLVGLLQGQVRMQVLQLIRTDDALFKLVVS